MAAFFAARGVPPERIINATVMERVFYRESQRKYYDDMTTIVANGIAEVLSEIGREAEKNG